jgi:AraC family transcriptional regulator
MKNATELKLVKAIKSDYLFASDFYEIKNWAFDFTVEKKVSEGYNDCFCIVFVKHGNFLLDLSSRSYDMHTGHIIVEKSDYEYRMRPAAGCCSIFNFSASFYEQFIHDCDLKRLFFFSNANLLSLLLVSSPDVDYLHHQIMKGVTTAGKLEMDSLVLGLVQQITSSITDRILDKELPASIRKNHISTIEKAKEYMNENFIDDISLKEVAEHCHTSPFHFCRTFKMFTSFSPHQYLLNIRLAHAERLLRSSTLPVADICFSSGFNSIEHFATTFKQKNKVTPTQFRKE